MTRNEAIVCVDGYLQATEERDIRTAEGYWARGPKHLQFPGQPPFVSIDEVIAWASTRYRWVKKHRDVYTVETIDGATTVVSQGRLYGENLHGVPFDDVRYVDIFTLRDGLITAQLVWNDLDTGDWLTRTAVTGEEE